MLQAANRSLYERSWFVLTNRGCTTPPCAHLNQWAASRAAFFALFPPHLRVLIASWASESTGALCGTELEPTGALGALAHGVSSIGDIAARACRCKRYEMMGASRAPVSGSG